MALLKVLGQKWSLGSSGKGCLSWCFGSGPTGPNRADYEDPSENGPTELGAEAGSVSSRGPPPPYDDHHPEKRRKKKPREYDELDGQSSEAPESRKGGSSSRASSSIPSDALSGTRQNGKKKC